MEKGNGEKSEELKVSWKRTLMESIFKKQRDENWSEENTLNEENCNNKKVENRKRKRRKAQRDHKVILYFYGDFPLLYSIFLNASFISGFGSALANKSGSTTNSRLGGGEMLLEVAHHPLSPSGKLAGLTPLLGRSAKGPWMLVL